jgi:hypothetical protein
MTNWFGLIGSQTYVPAPLDPKTYVCGFCNVRTVTNQAFCCERTDLATDGGRQYDRVYICLGCNKPTYFPAEGGQVPGNLPGEQVGSLPQDVDAIYVDARRAAQVGLGTTSDGHSVIALYQETTTEQSDEGPRPVSEKHGYLLVDAAGSTTEVDGDAPAELQEDCSDQPAALGDCVSSTMTAGSQAPVYLLADGGRVRWTGDGALARFAADGSVAWQLSGISFTDHAIRGDRLLVSAGLKSVLAIRITDGTPQWTVPIPSSF